MRCRELKSGLISTAGVGWPAKKMMGKLPTCTACMTTDMPLVASVAVAHQSHSDAGNQPRMCNDFPTHVHADDYTHMLLCKTETP